MTKSKTRYTSEQLVHKVRKETRNRKKPKPHKKTNMRIGPKGKLVFKKQSYSRK